MDDSSNSQFGQLKFQLTRYRLTGRFEELCEGKWQRRKSYKGLSEIHPERLYMKLERQKKLWQAPTLIVLVRNYPAESVLVTCKFTGVRPLSSSNTTQTGCRAKTGNRCPATQCSVLLSS